MSFAGNNENKNKLCKIAEYQLDKNKYDEAIKNFDLVLSKDPNNAQAYFGRAKARFLKHDIWHTKENFEKYCYSLKKMKLKDDEMQKMFMPLHLYIQDFNRALELNQSKYAPILKKFSENHPVLIMEMQIAFGSSL